MSLSGWKIPGFCCGFKTRSTVGKLLWLILEVIKNPVFYDYSTGLNLVFLLDSYGLYIHARSKNQLVGFVGQPMDISKSTSLSTSKSSIFCMIHIQVTSSFFSLCKAMITTKWLSFIFIL